VKRFLKLLEITFISQNASINLLLVQSVLLASEHKHVTTLISHKVHRINNYADCNFHRVILAVYQR